MDKGYIREMIKDEIKFHKKYSSAHDSFEVTLAIIAILLGSLAICFAMTELKGYDADIDRIEEAICSTSGELASEFHERCEELKESKCIIQDGIRYCREG